MSSPIPYLGSKISLISKSEIRYEGILYTIDAQESIIALAKVRSFGTEDRPTDMPVPARDEVYEYIIFRGTDIKKIEVCEAPKTVPAVHNDPAIVQRGAVGQPSSFSNVRQTLGPIGGATAGYGAYGQALSQGLQAPGGPSPFAVPQVSAAAVVPPIASTVPTVQQTSELAASEQKPLPAAMSLPTPIAPPSSVSAVSSSHVAAVTAAILQARSTYSSTLAANTSPNASSSLEQRMPQHLVAQPKSSGDVLTGSRSPTPSHVAARKSPVSDAGVQVSPPPQQDGRRRNNRMDRDQNFSDRLNRTRDGFNRRQGQSYNQGFAVPHQYRNQYSNGGYYSGYSGRGAGMGRGMGLNNRGGRRGRGAGIMARGAMMYVSNSRQREERKLFEKDYDFEQANTQFEELRVSLANTKISGGAAGGGNGSAATASAVAAATGSENGETVANGEKDKKDDSGNETGTGDENGDDHHIYYDKNKSFFDNISCEAVERSKGKSQRPDWRLERKINQETFGVAAARRGGFYGRGRGGGNFFNRGGYFRGGYNQGFYRGGGGGGNYRGGRGRSSVNGASRGFADGGGGGGSGDVS